MLYPIKIEFKDYPSGSWQDWSEYLTEPPRISKKVESEIEGQAGVIVFDDAEVSFRYESGSPVYNAFSIDLTSKQRYLFRISAPKSDKTFVQLFEGIADFSTLNWNEFENVISFSLVDKLSALNLLQGELTRVLDTLNARVLAQYPDADGLEFKVDNNYPNEIWIEAAFGNSESYYTSGFATPIIFPGEIIRDPMSMQGSYPSPITYALVTESWIDASLRNRIKYIKVDGFDYTKWLNESTYYRYYVWFSGGGIEYGQKEIYGIDILNYNAGVPQSINGFSLIEVLISKAWSGINFIYRGISAYNIPLSYYILFLDENPLGKTPLDALKMIADSMKCYLFFDRTGSNLIVQSKSSLATGGTTRSIGSTKIVSGPEKKYFWDKLVDGVTINVKSWAVDDLTGENLMGVAELTKQPTGFSSLQKIKPKNSIKRDLLVGDPAVDTQTELDSYAATEALSMLNFYGLRHSSFDMVLNLDDNTIEWELIDNIILSGLTTFFTTLEFDLVERTVKLQPVEIQGHDYDLRQITVGSPEASSSGIGGSSSSGVSSYYGVTPIFNLPLQMSGGIVSLLKTDNLKLTSNQLDTIQPIKITDTPTFNQILLSAAATLSNHAVRADRTLQITTNAPLTGGGIAVDLTANRSWTLGINSANLLGTTNQINVANGTGVILGLTNVTLSLPQNIHTAATPTFNQMLLSAAATLSNHAVRADRTLQITTNAPLTGGGIAVDLTADRNWTLGINSASLLGTTNQINVANGSGVILGLNNVTLSLPQNIHTAATPTFNQLTLSSAGSGSSNAVRADRTLQISTNAPLTGGGIAVDLTADRNWTLGINSASLLGTTNRITVTNGTGVILGTSNVTLNLPQDIHTGASPTFAGLTINGNILQSTNAYIKNNFTSGWTGSGWQLDYSVSLAGKSNLEIDSLTVRGSMKVYELIINQIRATNGSLFVSSTAKVASVNTGAIGDYSITFEDPEGHGYMPFADNDIIMMQRVDLNGTSIVRYLVGKVLSHSSNTIEFLIQDGTDTPQKGDVFVRIGSTSDANRQGTVYLTSDDTASPYIDIYDGVSNYSLFKTSSVRKVRLGKLTGLTDSDFGSLSGYGLYTTNAYLKGGIWATFGKIAGWTIDTQKLYNGTDIILDAANKKVSVNNDAVKMYYTSAGDYGIKDSAGKFQLGSTNQIAGWVFDTSKLSNSNTRLEASASLKGLAVSGTILSNNVDLLKVGQFTFSTPTDYTSNLVFGYSQSGSWGSWSQTATSLTALFSTNFWSSSPAEMKSFAWTLDVSAYLNKFIRVRVPYTLKVSTSGYLPKITLTLTNGTVIKSYNTFDNSGDQTLDETFLCTSSTLVLNLSFVAETGFQTYDAYINTFSITNFYVIDSTPIAELTNGAFRIYDSGGRRYLKYDSTDGLKISGGLNIDGITLKSANGRLDAYVGTDNRLGLKGYTLPLLTGGGAPASSTTYYWANQASAPATSAYLRLYVPKSGRIRGIQVNTYSISSPTISSGYWAMAIVINGGSPIEFASKSATSGTQFNVWENYDFLKYFGYGINVNEGDYIYIKETTPVFGTAPSTTYRSGVIYIE